MPASGRASWFQYRRRLVGEASEHVLDFLDPLLQERCQLARRDDTLRKRRISGEHRVGVVGLRQGQSRNEAGEIPIRCSSDQRAVNLVSRFLQHWVLMSHARHLAIHAINADTCFFGETARSHGGGEACVLGLDEVVRMFAIDDGDGFAFISDPSIVDLVGRLLEVFPLHPVATAAPTRQCPRRPSVVVARVPSALRRRCCRDRGPSSCWPCRGCCSSRS